uniref:Chitin-binding type-2 domain-containing protein n=1 Tax=Strongyloides papillosus TaxID=174720 RepID=A0A0N5B5M9_STREA
MIGDHNVFVNARGGDRLRFEARKDNYGDCNCQLEEKGFYNEVTKDCYQPTNISAMFHDDSIEWYQADMEVAAGDRPKDRY